MIRDDILTLDNLLHVLLGVVLVVVAVLMPPTAATAALYLREQGQAKSWTLHGSFHKHMEYVIPGLVLHVLWFALVASVT